MAHPRTVATLLLLGLLCCAGRVAAQQPDTVVVAPAAPAGVQEGVELPQLDEPTTPGGAFLRAVLLPGWGHASIGAYTRGGFYFTVEAASAFMLARTLRVLGAAKDARSLVEDRTREALLSGGTPADSVPGLLDQDPAVDDARELVDARHQQLEDWIAVGVFFVFLSGADAFVSAHLRDFPEPISMEATPLPGGAVGIGFRVPVGGRPRR